MVTEEILFIIDNDHQVAFDGNTFKTTLTHKTKDYYSAAVLPQSLIRTHGFKAPKTTAAEKLSIQAEMTMYEDGGLDPEVDFQIASLTIDLEHEDNLYVESYAIESLTIHQQFDAIAKTNRHIDLIFPPALSYMALYAFDKLDKKSDLFIYFGEHDAYAVIFKQGRYIATRVISTLEAIAKKVGIDVTKLRELLITKGVENERYGPDEFLHMHDIQAELSKVVERIAHSISHKRGIFRLETIERIFIDFEGSDIPGFLDMFESYGYDSASKQILDTFTSIEAGKKHDALQALYALGAAQEKYTPINFSVYERKPSFFKSHVGQFTLMMAASIIGAVAYPIYATLELEQLQIRHATLQSDVKNMETLTQKLRLKLKEEREKRDALGQQKSDAIAKINGYDHMLDALQNFDKETHARQKMMKDVNMAMKQFSLSSKYLEQNSSTSIKVQIITKYEKRDDIAKFMKSLIEQGYAFVQTQKIERDDNIYESLVEIRP